MCFAPCCLEEEGGLPFHGVGVPRMPVGALASHSVAAAAAAQAAMAAQVAALEQLRDKLEAGEPPEKKMALPAEEHQRLLQRALQHNLLAMTAQIPMNIRINQQGTGNGRGSCGNAQVFLWVGDHPVWQTPISK